MAYLPPHAFTIATGLEFLQHQMLCLSMPLAENERQALHVAPIRCLAELHSLLFESFACLVHVRHGNTDVSESSRVLVARMVLEVGVILRPPIVRKLHGTGL